MTRSHGWLVVFFDALGERLTAEVRPRFITALNERGGERAVIPSVGFCEYTAAFTGLEPAAAGHLTLYRFTQQSRAFRWLAHLGALRELVPRRLISIIARWRDDDMELVGTSMIPRAVLPHVEIVEVRRSFWKQRLPAPNILVDAEAAGLRPARIAGPAHWRSGEVNLGAVKDAFASGHRFVVVHIPDLDRVAHQYGPTDARVRDELIRLDRALEETVEWVGLHGVDLELVVFGDHGMVPVVGKIDSSSLKEELEEWERRGDCTVFLDSTMVRVRAWDPKIESRIRQAMNRLPHGRILEEQTLRRWGAWFQDRSYGDVLFLADPGYVVTPNYFQGRSPVAGMHGYAPTVTENWGHLSSSIPLPTEWPEVIPLVAVHGLLKRIVAA